MKDKKEEFGCDCCGIVFTSTYDEQKRFDKDAGWGICDECAIEIDAQNEREWQSAIKTLADGLNEINRAKFYSLDVEVQKGLVLQAIEDGVLRFSISRR